MIAAIVRLAISVRENKVLLEQVRTDPLTGLSNRGGMQLDLDAWVAAATEESPVAVVLFDLNGFKRYNDTFGHPAGDALLARLGAPAARGGRRGRHRLPDRRRRVLRTAHLRARSLRRGRRGRRRRRSPRSGSGSRSAPHGAVVEVPTEEAATRRGRCSSPTCGCTRRRRRAVPARERPERLAASRRPSSHRRQRAPAPSAARRPSELQRIEPATRGRTGPIAPASIAACRVPRSARGRARRAISRQRSQPSTEARRAGRSAGPRLGAGLRNISRRPHRLERRSRRRQRHLAAIRSASSTSICRRPPRRGRACRSGGRGPRVTPAARTISSVPTPA